MDDKQLFEIAAKLHRSPSTIETYCERMKLRLKLESLHELVRTATLWLHDAKG